MAETKIIHATKQAEDAVTKFIKSDIINEQTAKCNIAGNNVKRSSSNTAEAPGHVLMARTLELSNKESDTRTKLLERGVVTAASAAAAMISHFLRGVFNHHQEGYYIILVLFLVLGLILASTATWLARKHFAQVVALLALVPQHNAILPVTVLKHHPPTPPKLPGMWLSLFRPMLTRTLWLTMVLDMN
uniref:Uncharacterized protein n=1 Tax=Oryza glumipatula TaxID=40148 RepID=A0A0E0AGF9_9ORYZ